MSTRTTPDDVLIVGAGPAGIGVAAALARIGVAPTVLDRAAIGASFARWPASMRLLTPSFPANAFGLVDLNAITPDTSPGLLFGDEHPTGAQYAAYLELVAHREGITPEIGPDVVGLTPNGRASETDILVHLGDGSARRATAVVWAAGEAQYPRTNGFPGAGACRPTATVTDWAGLDGEHLVIIGGFESGMDAAVNLTALGHRVTVLDRHRHWEVFDPDPSRSLSPYTRSRVKEAALTGRLQAEGEVEVTRVTPDDTGAYVVLLNDGRRIISDGPPLLATGFAGSLNLLDGCFDHDDTGVVVREADDGSTVLPGLYLAGPMVRHRGESFCFIYKFRQRFGVVARAIGERLGVDTSPLEQLRDAGFLLDDLSCCGDCAC